MVKFAKFTLALCVCLLWASPSHQRALSILDLKSVIDRLGDEFFTHAALKPQKNVGPPPDSDIPHPIKVNFWGNNLKVGQVAAVSVNPADQPVVFHRGPTVWNQGSFGNDKRMRNPKFISEDAIVTLDSQTSQVVSSFGKNKFLMPHGLTVDDEGNHFVTDVGLHQVMRFPAGKTEPDLVLGVAQEPGHDHSHFCMPTAVAVAKNTGDFFVADGYCNSRIMKYNKDGHLIKIIRGNWKVPHSLALFDDLDQLCVADREGGRVECIKAGISKPLHVNRADDTGKSVAVYTDNIGRPYAIAAKGTALLVVNMKKSFISLSPNVWGVTIDVAADDVADAVIDQWGEDAGIVSPHDVAISKTGDSVYVAEVPQNKKAQKIHKFEVMNIPDLMGTY